MHGSTGSEYDGPVLTLIVVGMGVHARPSAREKTAVAEVQQVEVDSYDGT